MDLMPSGHSWSRVGLPPLQWRHIIGDLLGWCRHLPGTITRGAVERRELLGERQIRRTPSKQSERWAGRREAGAGLRRGPASGHNSRRRRPVGRGPCEDAG